MATSQKLDSFGLGQHYEEKRTRLRCATKFYARPIQNSKFSDLSVGVSWKKVKRQPLRRNKTTDKRSKKTRKGCDESFGMARFEDCLPFHLPHQP